MAELTVPLNPNPKLLSSLSVSDTKLVPSTFFPSLSSPLSLSLCSFKKKKTEQNSIRDGVLHHQVIDTFGVYNNNPQEIQARQTQDTETEEKMGKYTKKSRITGDVAVMEVTQSTALGIRTRARTLALQRLQQSPSTTATTTAAAAVVSCPNPDSSSCYLELRSRRLEKPLPPPPQPSVSKTQQGKVRLCGAGGEKKRESSGKKGGLVKREPSEAEDMGGIGVEASCGENCLDFELRGSRRTRETTPCSFIRDSETFGTPGSTTRQNRSDAMNRRITNVKNAEERHVPTTNEMEEFFSCVEQKQQRLFIEKYNFDVINDMPLPGRYEWV